MQIADRMQLVSESITLAVSAKANALKKAGVDVVGFGAGEPDFDTPAFIKEACQGRPRQGADQVHAHALHPRAQGGHRREVQQAKTACPTSPRTSPPAPAASTASTWRSWPCSTPAMRCIIPAPYWVSYPEQVKLAGGVNKFIAGEEKQRLQDHPAAARGGHHAQDQGLPHQLPHQPRRPRLHARGAQGPGRRDRQAPQHHRLLR